MGLGVICQTNLEIACSLRNNLRVSVVVKASGGKALDGLGGIMLTEPNQTLNTDVFRTAVGQWEMTFIVKRETTRTHR